MLDEKENAVAIIQKALEKMHNKNSKVKPEQINVKNIEKYNSSFINKIYQNKEADIVYKLKNREIFFLIEHQSKVDYSMPKRILEYQVLIMNSGIDKKKEKTKGYKYPSVIPIVLYTGKNKWNSNKYIEESQDMLDGYTYRMGNYSIIDINNYTSKELLEDNSFVMNMLLIEKSKNTEELTENFNKIISKINGNSKDKEILKNIILQVYMRKINKEDLQKMLNKINGGEENMMAVFEMIDKENQMYINKGRKESVIQIVKNMLKKKLSINTISEVTGLSQEEIEKIAKEQK